MISVLLALAIQCPAPILVGDDWDDEVARAAVTTATRTCRVRYNGCLVRMIRLSETNFHAICRKGS